MRKNFTFIFTLIAVSFFTQGLFAQTLTKFGYSWEVPFGWEQDKIDGSEVYMTPSREVHTVSFISIKSFSIKDENAFQEEAKRFLLGELGTKDDVAFDNAVVEEVSYNGLTAIRLAGSYLNDDLEFTDYIALLIPKNKNTVVIAMGTVWNDGEGYEEAAGFLEDIDYVLQSTSSK